MIQTLGTPSEIHPIDAVIAEHGARRVALRAIAALFTRHARLKPPPISDHLRRDIGLPPERPPPHYLDHWR